MATIVHRSHLRHGAALHDSAEAATSETSRRRVESIAAALLELATQLVVAADDDEACRRLAAGIKELGDAETVGVALVSPNATAHVRALTGLNKIDRQTEGVRAWQRAITTSMRNDAPDGDGTPDRPWCVVLRSRNGKAFAVCAFIAPAVFERAEHCSLLKAALEILAPIFEAALQSRRSSLMRRIKNLANRLLRGRRGMLATAAALVAASFVPLPLPIRCECGIEPQVRRSVVAPFSAIWRSSRVRPGDLVVAGQTLGLLDDSELRRELVAATAERDRAAKSADVNAASGKTAAAQIDRLEVRRIEERRSLLISRLQSIEVKSPIAGIVLSGEWEQAEGAPLKQGVVLYEVAPLDHVVVEVFIPEAESDHLAPGATAGVVLDSQPGAPRIGTIERIHPRAEIHDDENVFVAEIVLENSDGALRPGMRGYVDITAPSRSTADRLVDRWLSLRLPVLW